MLQGPVRKITVEHVPRASKRATNTTAFLEGGDEALIYRSSFITLPPLTFYYISKLQVPGVRVVVE